MGETLGDSQDVREILIDYVNKLSVFKKEETDTFLRDFKNFIYENRVNPGILYEVIAGFIIERCDNLLANIVNEELRSLIENLVAYATNS